MYTWSGVSICLCLSFSFPISTLEQQGEGYFVDKLGVELWSLSQLVTKYSEVTTKYKSLNARVDTNDGRSLTGQIADNIGKMLDRRTLAVKCIQEASEELIASSDSDDFIYLNFTQKYHSMQYSGVPRGEIRWEVEDETTYLNLKTTKNRHFYNIPVNTEESAVHIPTNLYDRYPHVAETIHWSEYLNNTFISNYHSDPDLGWQYFGASSGMMRLYPAMTWHDVATADLYDCRTRTWFIEAATCAKDVVILMDSSGSMTGMRSTIAKLVVNNLLATLSNNDMVNVLNYSLTATPVIPCLQSLVPANVQNIKDLHEAVNRIKPLGNASVPVAFASAFKLLEQARESRDCESACSCQQLIMLVTDGLPGNITEVFEEYNRDNDSAPCVRVFTYLLGLEVQGVREMQQIACDNRGYYVHMTALDQVKDKVLRYLTVMSRPQALNIKDHPVRWTHLFADIEDPKVGVWLRDVMEEEEQKSRLARHKSFARSEYFSPDREDAKYVKIQVEGEDDVFQEYRLMTSVAMPVYDTRDVITNQSLRWDLLAGVAGTDVPVHDLLQLTYPYKIGANGYAFIITNNGHLLMHPDHRPVEEGFLKDNYNSVDLLDVEFAADKDGEEKLQELRKRMIDHGEGDIQSIKVKFHYDDMRRVGIERRDYYFAPLVGTPFSLGLAIPADYGNYQIGVKDMVNERLLMTATDPLKAFFRDREWRIHPDWMYCKYRFDSHKAFGSKEEELLDILGKIKSQADWKKFQTLWKESGVPRDEDDPEKCNRPQYDDDAFICDAELLILLIFDASVTNDSFRDPVTPKNNYESKLLKTYNATLRFATTQSGLTRWQKIPKPVDDDDGGDFGDVFSRAIDEPWFKSAVLQSNLDAEGEQNKSGDSFVFSVPFNAGKLDDIEVTATVAIFPRDGGRKAPASVLGYRLTYASFYEHFIDLSKLHKVDCETEGKQCYVLDHNAIVVLSEFKNDIGRPFATVEASAMAILLELGFYRETEITDFQGLVITTEFVSSGATFGMDKPWQLAIYALSWIWSHIALSLFQHIGLAVAQQEIEIEIDDDDYTDEVVHISPIKPASTKKEEAKPVHNITVRVSEPAYITRTFYLFSPDVRERHYKRPSGESSRLMSARTIQHTNLLFVAVDRLHPIFADVPATGWPTERTVFSMPCDRFARSSNLTRRSLANCTAFHPKEVEVGACGRAAVSIPNAAVVVLPLVVLLLKVALSIADVHNGIYQCIEKNRAILQ